MPLWGSKDQANNAPKYKILDHSPNTGIQLYGTRIVGTDVTEQQANHKINHAGWNRISRGTGPVTTVAITAGGAGYANTDTLVISSSAAQANSSTLVNATASLVTNATGGITSVTITNGGRGFQNTSILTYAVQAANGAASAGNTATFTATLGGRSGRVHAETMIAMGSMTGNGSTVTF